MSTKKIILSILFLAVVSVVVTSCYKDREELLYPFNCATSPATFSKDISPLFESKCKSCHDGTQVSQGASILITYSQISTDTAGIRYRCLEIKDMPRGTTFTSTEEAKLKCWLDNGAQNN